MTQHNANTATAHKGHGADAASVARCVESTAEEPPLGAVIYAQRALYRHYGVYAGAGRVIHFAAEQHYETNAKNALIQETTMDDFLRGDVLCVEQNQRGAFSAAETVRRAQEQIGQQRGKYSLVFNNCEHFAHWCKYGKRRSQQVQRVVAGTVAIVTAVASMVLAAAKRGKNTERT